MSDPNLNPELKALLKREHMSERLEVLDAVALVPGQPFHRTGLLVLRRYPLLALLVFAQAVLVGMIVYEISFFFFTRGVIPLAENRVILLGGMMTGLQERFTLFAHFPPAAAVVALVPYLYILNLSWTVLCGTIYGKGPTWKWLLVGFLGLVPLRILAPRFLSKWEFWSGRSRSQAMGQARLLQFTTVFMVVSQMTRRAVTDVWASLLDRQLKDVVDSYFSFVYLPIYVAIGAYLAAVIALYVGYQVGVALPFSASAVVVASAVYFALNRALLGLATFHWLNGPQQQEVPPLGRWKVRLTGMVVFVGIGYGSVVGITNWIAGPPSEQMAVHTPFILAGAKSEIEYFLLRNKFPDSFGSADRLLPRRKSFACWQGRDLRYLAMKDGTAPNALSAVAEVRTVGSGMVLRYMRNLVMNETAVCEWIEIGFEDSAIRS